MKTLDDLFMEMSLDKTLKKEFEEAASQNALDDFLKKQGVAASQKEVAAYVKQKQEEAQAAGSSFSELSEEDMENVVGGSNFRVSMGVAFWQEVTSLLSQLPLFK